MSAARLEPGLLRVLRVLTAVQLLSIPLVRSTGAAMGVDMPLSPYFLVSVPVPLLLVALVSLPAAVRRLGPRLLSVIVALEFAHLLALKAILLGWLVSLPQRDLLSLMLLVRLWPHFHCATLLVAWQHSWRAALVSAVMLCAVDSALSVVFASAGSPLHPLLLGFLVARAATVVGVASGVGWLLERQREQKAQLADANRKLADHAATAEQLAISQERNRLARELHDTLAHSVTGVTVQLEAIQALWPVNATAARAMLDSALQTARNGSSEARRALRALRAGPLDDVGLSVAIGNLARSAATRSRLRLELSTSAAATARPDQEQFLYRVAQEAIANVVRHAQAAQLRVVLERVDGLMTLTVADDGVGFEKSAVDTGAHFGLTGMLERVEMIGGRLSVESGHGRGTTVRVTVPVDAGA